MLIANSIQSNICCNFFNKVEETLKYTPKLLLVIVSKINFSYRNRNTNSATVLLSVS